MSTALAFQSTKFDVIDQNGQPWLQARQIGKALGYSRPDAILNIYQRNKDEFSVGMTSTIELMVGDTPQETRIFSLRGCHLLAMFARTPRAKLFRIWVLDVLESLGSPEPRPAPEALTPSTVADRKPLNDLVQIWVDAAPITKRQAWEMIHAHFCIASIKDFTVEELEIVMDFVQARIDALPKSLPEAAHAEAPALKYPLHDFKQAEDVNRALVNKTMRLAMDWSQQLRKLADEAGDAFNHTERRSNIMGLLDSTVYSHKEAIKRLSTAVGESVLAIAAQHEALMQLAQLMRRQEKM